MNAIYLLLCSAGLLALVIWGAVSLFRYHNSPDAERHRRTAAQGPFVPVSKEDIAADEKRKTRA